MHAAMAQYTHYNTAELKHPWHGAQLQNCMAHRGYVIITHTSKYGIIQRIYLISY